MRRLRDGMERDAMRDVILPILQTTGPLASPGGLAAVEPQLTALGVVLQRNSAGEIRGRLYLRDGSVVDVVPDGGWGQPWAWIVRSGPTEPGPVDPPPTPDPPPVVTCPCEAALATIVRELQTANAQHTLVLDALGQLTRLVEALPDEAALRASPLPVKFRW